MVRLDLTLKEHAALAALVTLALGVIDNDESMFNIGALTTAAARTEVDLAALANRIGDLGLAAMDANENLPLAP